jgi:hypothetical protein
MTYILPFLSLSLFAIRSVVPQTYACFPKRRWDDVV